MNFEYEAPPQKKCNTLVVWLKPHPHLEEYGRYSLYHRILYYSQSSSLLFSNLPIVMAPRPHIDVGIRIQCLVLLEYGVYINIVSEITNVHKASIY